MENNRMYQSESPQSKVQPLCHNAYDNTFDYKTHYQRDAIAFDYFGQSLNNDAIHENRRLHEAIINELSLDTKEALNVGCGNAWLARYLLPEGFELTSTDISATNVKKALDLYPSERHKGIVADAFSLPFEDESFQNVIAAEVMEHVTSPDEFVKSLLRVVKKGGKLIISTPYNEKIPQYLCVHCNCLTPRNAHLHSFDEDKVLSLAPNSIVNKKAMAFSNSFLAKTQSHVILQYLQYKVWRIIDRIANKIVNKPSRLLFVIKK